MQATRESTAGSGPIEIAPRIYWVGARLADDPFQCHAYLIEHGTESVLFDPGSALTFAEVRRKVEEIVPLSHVRYFVCSHQDPDITGAMPIIDEIVRRPDAVVVSHWRTAALLKHLALRMPLWNIDAHGWQLDLGGRVLRFVLTPYLHFAGAFCTLDEQTGTLFSSDLFGGFTQGDGLYAEDIGYFEEIRAFHEHYMPSREILVHGLLRLEEHPIRMIAPQHGRIIPEPLVRPIIERLKTLDCGLYLMTRDDTDVRRLLQLSTMRHDVMEALLREREFADAARAVLSLARKVFRADALDIYVDEGDAGVAHFAEHNGYRGEIVDPPTPVREALTAREVTASHHVIAKGSAFGSAESGDRVVVPLASRPGGGVGAAAVFRTTGALTLSAELDEVLGQLATPLGVAAEREAAHRLLERERDKLSRALDDLRRTQAQLVQAQKLEAIGALAAGVAHEINTPVQYVGDNLTFVGRACDHFGAVAKAAIALLAERSTAPTRASEELARVLKKAKIDYLLTQVPSALEQSRDGLSRVAAIVGALKEFSHTGSQEKEPVDLVRAITTTLTVARNEWRSVADVETDFSPDLPAVPALRNQLNQVILNLIVNAAHAVGDAVKARGTAKGVIRVAARVEEGFAVVEVSDTGTGIPESIRNRIFEPFFTTKPVGKGTGQGLAIAYNVVVERHGGRIDVRSEVGKGSTFIVRLPLSGGPEARAVTTQLSS